MDTRVRWHGLWVVFTSNTVAKARREMSSRKTGEGQQEDTKQKISNKRTVGTSRNSRRNINKYNSVPLCLFARYVGCPSGILVDLCSKMAGAANTSTHEQ